MTRLIDADKLVDLFKQHKAFYINAYGGFENMPIKEKARCDELDNCIADIVNATTADDWQKYSDELWKNAYEKGKADRPHGKWIEYEQFNEIMYYCSNCLVTKGQAVNNFCACCGADMRKPQTQKFADNDTAYGGLASAT